MITIPELVEQIVRETPFLEEGLSQGLINYSALARILKLRLEEVLMKNVTEGSIVMALRRSENHFKNKTHIKKVFKTTPDILVRSHLIEYTVLNSDSLLNKQRQLLELFNKDKIYFFTFTRGLFETTILASYELGQKLEKMMVGETVIAKLPDLSALTIRLTKEVVDTPGVYYFILKILAWENINMIEVISAYTELTIVLREQEVDKAFSVLKAALSP